MAQGTIIDPPRGEQTLHLDLAEFRVSLAGRLIFAEYMVRDADGNVVEQLPVVTSDPADWATLAPKLFRAGAERELTLYMKAKHEAAVRRLLDAVIT